MYRRCGDIYLVPVCCLWPLSLLLQRRGGTSKSSAVAHLHKKKQSKKLGLAGQQPSLRFLAITEEKCLVYIGGAATFTWYRRAASCHCRCYFSAEGAPAHQAHLRTWIKKNRAEKLGLAGQQPRSRYFWRSQRNNVRYISAVRRLAQPGVVVRALGSWCHGGGKGAHSLLCVHRGAAMKWTSQGNKTEKGGFIKRTKVAFFLRVAVTAPLAQDCVVVTAIGAWCCGVKGDLRLLDVSASS